MEQYLTHGVIFLISMLLILTGIIEYYLHNKKLSKIPVRILVNGSRGKSTVTRLISSVLTEAGYSVTARVTGTNAMHILDDGSEAPVKRKAGPRIIEIIDTIRIAEKRNSDAVVIECMALVPEYQKLLASTMVKPGFTVITNVRADHLDVMGPELNDIAESFASTIYKNGKVIEAGSDYTGVFRKEAKINSAEIISASNGINRVDSEIIKDLPGIRENLEIVLALGREMGIPSADIFAGIKKASQESGGEFKFRISVGNICINALNFFSANDPESTEKLIKININRNEPVILIYNHRADRVERGLQFCSFFNKCSRLYNVEGIVFIGEGTFPFARRLQKTGWPKHKLIRKRRLNSIENFMQQILLHFNIDNNTSAEYSAAVIGVGNISGYGADIVDYWNSCKRI